MTKTGIDAMNNVLARWFISGVSTAAVRDDFAWWDAQCERYL
jgi:hypothetical protein